MQPTSKQLDYDVVVIGGGPHGLTYANWLKKWRPDTRIAVLEKRTTPGYKVGESTLSSATRSFVSMGLEMPVLRRLFGNKSGVRFWWTNRNSDELQRHVDVVDIEETFQVERRPLEMAMQEITRRRGVDLHLGTAVQLKKSKLEGETKVLSCTDANGKPVTIRCKMICDASGPAALLTRHFGHARKAAERHDTFTTNSYFAYFRPKRDLPQAFWDEPATRHICFPGGWMWFITLASWDQTPEENLRGMVHELLDTAKRAGDDDALYENRKTLAERHGCTSEKVVSIGFVVRADQEQGKAKSARERFEEYAETHPAIAWVLDHFELIEEPYGNRGNAFGAFRDLVRDAEHYAGDGWVSVGDAACFVNPLFSPGLNLGAGSCYMAAKATAAALDAGNCRAHRFVAYESYMREVYEAVLTETDLYYRGFDNVDSYEAALKLKVQFAALELVDRDGAAYCERDPFAHDLLNPRFREQVESARALLRGVEWSEDSPGSAGSESKVAKTKLFEMCESIDRFLGTEIERSPVDAEEFASLFNEYDEAGKRVATKIERNTTFGVRQCRECDLFHDRTLQSCPTCGTRRVSLQPILLSGFERAPAPALAR